MSSRREFLKNSGALALSSLMLPAYARPNSLTGLLAPAPIGLQLYTITKLMAEDPKGTLQKVAAIGYKEIETAGGLKEGYYGFKPKEFKAIIDDLGMKWRAHHAGGAPFRPRTPPSVGGAPAGATPPAGGPPPNADRQALMAAMAKRPNLRDNYQQLVDDAAEGGLSYLVCASTPVATLDEINKSIEVFQKTGEACKKAGIAFAYHNHATEFDPVDGGKTPYELILSQTDKELVKMELDLAWATKAGKDPVALFKEMPGRFPLWHIKDIKDDLKTITEVGNGVVDFKRIFKAAKTAGLKYYFVEQDAAPGIENVSISYQNLAKVVA
ncbi:sugar phosphate isomerase/epimerase family protein [Larkinella rosea]|uniref:Sugar phosphate isomerase/epimerase n=1 Tax=Larkinella rosea TaxID=2025312 RepID=A0A3P1BNP5_9BACT|nr:sugar phosphate isomerase/epimerase [Larkinella rosea]RRB02533.1 sugar phosphate isomerase/epimerase [Larkinella rosea]